VSLVIISACTSPSVVEVNITNELSIPRNNETIEIDLKQIPKLLSEFVPDQILIRDGNTNQIVLSQLIDLNGDQTPDQLIFQSDFMPNESKHFHLEGSKEKIEIPGTNKSTYARFIPERIDDFAWENDRVAFRTYGPKAQALTESGDSGGTLSSGIDCWLKRVEYPIIDKWYKQDLEQGKSYHQDHGEGLDNYHVGPSRGTGGIGIWKEGRLLTSKNFKSWKIIANGPIRTIFELNYGPWDANGLAVEEIKHISIDLGSNLFKNTLILDNYENLPNITIGITLHEKNGEVKTDIEKGWFRYWEPHDDSELSAAIVVDPSIILESIDNRVDVAGESNLLVVCKPEAKLTYYAGFAWGKSNQFDLPDGFDKYLKDYAARVASPLEVEIIE
jgi:hypothetical protein